MTADIEPLTEEELASLPVFPLPQVVLFPGAVLPLHLFEPRYREMARDCVTGGPMAIAIALLAPGWEPDYEGNPDFHPIAGAGRITEHRERRDGCFDLILHGVARVRLEELPAEDRTYRRARASVIGDRVEPSGGVDRIRPRVLATAALLVAMVRADHPEFDLGIDADMPASQMADRIADRLIASVELRQRVLATANVKVRLAIVQEAMVDLLARLRAHGTGGALH